MLTFKLYESLSKTVRKRPSFCRHCMSAIADKDIEEDGEHFKHTKCGRVLASFVKHVGDAFHAPSR